MRRTKSFTVLARRFGALARLAACSSTSPIEAQSNIIALSLGTAQSFAVLGSSTVRELR